MMNNINERRPSFENGLIRLVSGMIHTKESSINPLIKVCEDYRFSIPESAEYRGIDISAITMGNMDFGAYHRARIPMHESGRVLNILRTLVSSPGNKDTIESMVSDMPSSMREYRTPNAYASSAREYVIDSMKLFFLEGISTYGEDNKIGISEFIKDNDADLIVAYVKDDAMLNSSMKRTGMIPARGNLGKDSSERIFAWYISR